MTSEERFERIEYVTAALVEERRKDREEYRGLWRDTQRQINEVTLRLNDVTLRLNDITLKIADTNDTITRLAEESRAEDRRLGERIDALVSAIGRFMATKE